MPFPIRPDWTAADFKSQIFDYYWDQKLTGTTLQQQIEKDNVLQATSKANLIEDYCILGSFLASSKNVLAALVSLENEIRTELQSQSRAELQQKIQNFNVAQAKAQAVTNRHGEAFYFKTDKLLSGILTKTENLNGFNNSPDPNGPVVVSSGTLHSQATVGVKDQGFVKKSQDATKPGFNMAQGGRGKDAVTLPVGVPGLTGGVGGIDFNRILLRYGYHWKDVGAGALGHGEYTHRIQWYAMTAEWKNLKLTNTPLQVFKSMGSLWARSTYPVPLDKHNAELNNKKTYVWEALFDCFKSASARTDGSIAYSDGTYNCPDNLNSELIRVSPEHKYTDPSTLFCLRVLTNARNFKRTKAAEIDPLKRLMEDRKKVTEVFKQDNKDAYLVWYFTQ